MKHQTVIPIVHETIELNVSFDAFTTRLELLLGRFDPAIEQALAGDPAAAEHRIEAMAGEQGLMIFAVLDHGAVLALRGKSQKAKRYLVGNPLVALEMTKHDVRAGLYAPLSVLVYDAGPSTTRIELDRPSSLFGQLGNEEISRRRPRSGRDTIGRLGFAEHFRLITRVGRELDAKLSALFAQAADERGQRRAA